MLSVEVIRRSIRTLLEDIIKPGTMIRDREHLLDNLKHWDPDDNDQPLCLMQKLKYRCSDAQAVPSAAELEDTDLIQLSYLEEVMTELNFDLYLASVEMEVLKKDNHQELDRAAALKCVVSLAGSRVKHDTGKAFRIYPDDLLDDADGDPYKAIDEGCATKRYYYRHTVWSTYCLRLISS